MGKYQIHSGECYAKGKDSRLPSRLALACRSHAEFGMLPSNSTSDELVEGMNELAYELGWPKDGLVLMSVPT